MNVRIYYDDYMNYLGKVDSIIQSADTNYVLVIGDMNADTYSGSDSVRNSLFGRELVSFCRENNFILSDVEKLASNNDIFTHYSAAHHTVSWLDHCVSTISAHNLITDITICDRYVVSDHLPFRIAVNCDIISISDEYSCINSCDQIILCNSVTDTDKATYTNKCDELLQKK